MHIKMHSVIEICLNLHGELECFTLSLANRTDSKTIVHFDAGFAAVLDRWDAPISGVLSSGVVTDLLHPAPGHNPRQNAQCNSDPLKPPLRAQIFPALSDQPY